MTAVFAFLAILLAALTGHAGSAGTDSAPVARQQVVAHPLPSHVGHSSQRTDQVPAGPTVTVHPESVAPAPVLDPEHPDYAPQNPDEVIGRQIDCPDGSVGTVIDAAGDVHCP